MIRWQIKRDSGDSDTTNLLAGVSNDLTISADKHIMK